ncbi:Golgin subfamily A member 7/ERF4 family-domain-containing protein, partial [Cryomyces antarcticus]
PREPSSRLWNPINSSPRIPPAVVHAPPNIPITHPELTEGRPQQSAEGRDAYPLLTLSEQRRSRHSYAGSSAIVEGGSVSGRNSAAIPEGQRRTAAPPAMETAAKIAGVEDAGRHTSSSTTPAPQPASHDVEASAAAPPLRRTPSRSSLPATLSRRTSQHTTYTGRLSTTAPHDPDSDDDDDALPWSPAHPCYPHPNPHVPLTSPLAHSTRIIRIQRDWLAGTDAVPAFANLYPEILDPVLPEPAFRLLVAHINAALAAALSPWRWRSWLDALLGAATGWVWEDVGAAGARGRLRALDAWLEHWNRTEGARDGVAVVPLTRTAYLSLDVQIPDPHVGAVQEQDE